MNIVSVTEVDERCLCDNPQQLAGQRFYRNRLMKVIIMTKIKYITNPLEVYLLKSLSKLKKFLLLTLLNIFFVISFHIIRDKSFEL